MTKLDSYISDKMHGCLASFIVPQVKQVVYLTSTYIILHTQATTECWDKPAYSWSLIRPFATCTDKVCKVNKEADQLSQHM